MKIDGTKLREIRKSKGMTQTELGQGICSTSYISKIEQGKIEPSQEGIEAMATRLEVSVQEICVEEVSEVIAEAPEMKTTKSSQALAYLSRHEQDKMIFMNAMLHKTDEIVEELQAHNGDSQMIDLFTAGRKLIFDGMQTRLRHINLETFKKLDRDCRLLTIGLCHKSDAERWKKKFYAEDAEMHRKAVEQHGPDAYNDLAEIVLVTLCQTCNGDPCKSKEGCAAFKAMQTLRIDPWDEEHAKCPYAGAGLMPVKAGA